MPTTIAGVELLSLDEIRAAFPAHQRPAKETLRRYLASRKLEGRKIGRSWFCARSVLRRYFDSQLPQTPIAPAYNPSRKPLNQTGCIGRRRHA
jgi:hypothetical protein